MRFQRLSSLSPFAKGNGIHSEGLPKCEKKTNYYVNIVNPSSEVNKQAHLDVLLRTQNQVEIIVVPDAPTWG